MVFSTLDELLRSRMELMLDTQRNYGWGSREAGQLVLAAVDTTKIELADDGESAVVGRGATSKVTLDLVVDDGMANTNGVAHGGYLATLADLGSSLPIAAIWQDGRWDHSLGVSTNINTYYLAPAQIGMPIRLVAWTVHVGSVTATLQFEITDRETGRILAYGTHVKQDPKLPPSQVQSKL